VVHAEIPLAASAGPDLRAMVDMITGRALSSETATALIMGHVFRDFPTLKLVCIESGVTWMDQTMEWLDNQAREHPAVFPGLLEPPSALFRRHVFGTVAWDMTESAAHRDFASDNLMWSIDPPHHDAGTMARVNAIQATLAARGRTRILADNAAAVFGLAP
jgi:predicted TIM-barrel fold metal-dependent hydrolase